MALSSSDVTVSCAKLYMQQGLRIKGVDLVLNPLWVLYYLHAMYSNVMSKEGTLTSSV